MKKYSFIIILSFILSSHHMVSPANRSTALYLNLTAPDNLLQQDAWDIFHRAAFYVPEILHYAQQHHLPFILLISQNLDGLTPLDPKSPVIEGMRVALTWTSIYYRFSIHECDVRIIQIPQGKSLNTVQMYQAIKKAVVKKIDLDLNEEPEKQIKKRFIGYDSLENEPSITKKIRLIDTSCNVFQPHLLTPRVIKPPFREYTSKRVLVTGGSGFIGNHVVKKLLELGYQVIALDNFSCSTIDNIQDILQHPNFFFIEHDVTEPFTVEGPLDSIIHLASVPSPEVYYSKPLETMCTGIHGTKNCLELAQEKKSRFLFSSTSEVYGDPAINPQPEYYPGNVSTTGKRSQYDQSKRGGETLVKLYFDRYHIDVRIARIFNTYGPYMGLGDGRVITNFIRAVLENKPILLYGGGEQTRSFAYVDDTVDGILRLLETPAITATSPIHDRIFNIGNPNEFTINMLAQKINDLGKKYLDRSTPITAVEQPDGTDPRVRCPDLMRARAILGFNPTINLEEGLEKTFCYFLEKQQA